MAALSVRELAGALDEGFRQDTAEKVYRLLALLRELEETSAARGNFTLKGGTALNVFHLKDLPRLSVDADLMVTGAPAAAPRTRQREEVLDLVRGLARRLGYRVIPRGNAGGAGVGFFLRYENSLQTGDGIKVDLDLLNRQTLLPPFRLPGPDIFDAGDFTFPVVDRPELLGQKLTAVAYRQTARDPFDMYRMLQLGWHTVAGARGMYLAYSFLQDAEWHRLDYPTRLDEMVFGPLFRTGSLEDVLRLGEAPPSLSAIRESARRALRGAHPPFTSATEEEKALRQELVSGHTSAFAAIAGVTEPRAKSALEEHPGLEFRLRVAQGREA